MDILRRNNVTIRGSGNQAIVFAHGLGCNQQMWRFVSPAFEATHRVVLFDQVGFGQSDLHAWDAWRHARLDGYAQDLAEVLDVADVDDAVFVGHSVSAISGILASVYVTQRIARLVFVGPSPRYVNDPPHYVGGFERSEIDALLAMMDRDALGWASSTQAGEGCRPTRPTAAELGNRGLPRWQQPCRPRNAIGDAASAPLQSPHEVPHHKSALSHGRHDEVALSCSLVVEPP